MCIRDRCNQLTSLSFKRLTSQCAVLSALLEVCTLWVLSPVSYSFRFWLPVRILKERDRKVHLLQHEKYKLNEKYDKKCLYMGNYGSCRENRQQKRRLTNFNSVYRLSLTLSPPIPLRLYTLPYWSNPPFLIFDIRPLWRSLLSARAPECQKLKMVR